MPLTVTFTDNADGTGAVAHATGTGGGTVSVYTQLEIRGGWVQVGTRTGDGAVSVSAPTGMHWGYARTASELTPPELFAVTRGDALATRCRDAVKAVIEAMALDGLRTVTEKPYPDMGNADFPCVQVTADGVREGIEPGLNNTNDIGYPVRVLIIDRHEVRDASRLRTRYEPWRLAMMEAFLDRRLPGVPESVQCLIEPLPVLDRNLPAYQFVVSGFVVRCRTRKTR